MKNLLMKKLVKVLSQRTTITIVVLMILAAVAISSIKNDGIIAHAENAGNKYTAAQELESLRLAYQEYLIERYTNNTLTLNEKLTELTQQIEERNDYKLEDLTATIVTLNSGRTYRVLSNGNMTEIDMKWYTESDENTTEYVLTTPAQLVGLEQLVNEGNTLFAKRNGARDITIKLGNDIDLGGIEWIPIGTFECGKELLCFNQTFDGQGHTISNLNTRSYEFDPIDNDPAQKYLGGAAGLFGVLYGKVQNLNLKNVKVQSTHYAGAFVGSIGSQYHQGEIANCHVDGAVITSSPMLIPGGTYDNGDKVGGIAGYVIDASVIGCSVKNTTITAYRDIGGIAGAGSSGNTQIVIQDNEVLENVKIVVDNSHNYKNYTTNSAYNVNSIVGRLIAATNPGVKDNSGTATITLPY